MCLTSINVTFSDECNQGKNMEITCHILLNDRNANNLLSEQEVINKEKEISKMRAIISVAKYEVSQTTTNVIYRMKIQAIERELKKHRTALHYLNSINQLETYRHCKGKQD